MCQLLTDLGGHDQLVVDHIVRSESHAKERAGGVKVTGHPSTTVYVLPDTLRQYEPVGVVF